MISTSKCLFYALLLFNYAWCTASFEFDLVKDKCKHYKFSLHECEEYTPTVGPEDHCQCAKTGENLLFFKCLTSWATPKFEVEDFSSFENHTLIYNTAHLGRVCHETFPYVKLGRIEFPYGHSIETIEHGAFKDVYVNSIFIDLGSMWVRNMTWFEGGVFTGIAPGTTTDEQTCAKWSRARRKEKEADEVTGACFAVEIQATVKSERYNRVAKAEIGGDVLQGLEGLRRLTILGNIQFRQSSGTGPLQKLFYLKYLKLSGMAFINSQDFLGRVDNKNKVAPNLESLHLINDKDLRLNDAHLSDWLDDRGKHIRYLSIEGGFSISRSLLTQLGSSFNNLTYLSLRDTEIPDEQDFHANTKLAFAGSIEYLDLGGTVVTKPIIEFQRFKNVRQIILGNPANSTGKIVDRFCECLQYEWIMGWGPYLKHKENLFVEDVNGGRTKNLLDKNRPLQSIHFKLPKGRVDLKGCIDWCRNPNSATENARDAMPLVAAATVLLLTRL